MCIRQVSLILRCIKIINTDPIVKAEESGRNSSESEDDVNQIPDVQSVVSIENNNSNLETDDDMPGLSSIISIIKSQKKQSNQAIFYYHVSDKEFKRMHDIEDQNFKTNIWRYDYFKS